jgi:hypothetical protein
MEISKSIKDAENALRDFLQLCLERNFGEAYTTKLGLPSAKIDVWLERKAQAEISHTPSTHEERLIYYAPFEDLYQLISENWIGDFQATFSDRERLMVFLKIIEEYRHPDTFRRELFVHQKHLLLGITGELRSKIAAYRSLMEIGKEGFPRIEYVKDSLGNIWLPGKPRKVKTQAILHTGDRLEFIVQAHDPEAMPVEYKIHGDKWQSGNILFFDVEPKHVKKQAQINITIRSSRKFHAYPLGYDDRVVFEYQVVPKAKKE